MQNIEALKKKRKQKEGKTIGGRVSERVVFQQAIKSTIKIKI